MNNDKLQRAFWITFIIGVAAYIVCELYSRYNENRHREQLFLKELEAANIRVKIQKTVEERINAILKPPPAVAACAVKRRRWLPLFK